MILGSLCAETAKPVFEGDKSDSCGGKCILPSSEYMFTMVLRRLCSVRGRSPGAQLTGRAWLVDAGDTTRAGSTSTAEEFAVETIADGVVVLKTQIVYKTRADLGVVLPAF